MRKITYFIIFLLLIGFFPVYSELKYSSGIIFKNGVIGVHFNQLYIRGKRLDGNIELFSIGRDGYIKDSVYKINGDRFLNGEYIGTSEVHYLDNGSLLVNHNNPKSGENYFVELDGEKLFEGDFGEYNEYMSNHTFYSLPIYQYFIDNKGKTYKYALIYEKARFLELDNTLIYDFYCDNGFLKYGYKGEMLTELIGSADELFFFKYNNLHGVRPTVLLNLGGEIYDLKTADKIKTNKCSINYSIDGEKYTVKVTNPELVDIDESELESESSIEVVMGKYKIDISGEGILFNNLEDTYISTDKKYLFEIRKDNWGYSYFLNSKKIFDDKNYDYKDKSVLYDGKYLFNATEYTLIHEGEFIELGEMLSLNTDSSFKYSLKVDDYEDILKKQYKNEPVTVVSSKVTLYTTERLEKTKSHINNMKNGKSYVSIIDKLVKRYEGNKKILNLLLERINQIKSKTNNHNKVLILSYIEIKVLILINGD